MAEVLPDRAVLVATVVLVLSAVTAEAAAAEMVCGPARTALELAEGTVAEKVFRHHRCKGSRIL